MKKLIVTIALTLSFAFFLSAQTKKPIAKTTPAKANTTNPASIARGKMAYSQYCLSCHQPDGGGVTGLNPPLIKTEYVLGDKTRLINIILKGYNKGVEIDGEVYSNPMPPLNFLTDQQVADVLTYVRNNFQNKTSAITPMLVKTVRASNK